MDTMTMTSAERKAEVGDQPDCPFCGTARLKRTDYIRCGKCGVNWMDGEDLSCDPRESRRAGWMRNIIAKPPSSK
jgi:ribosomal protein L37AE/L43A